MALRFWIISKVSTLEFVFFFISIKFSSKRWMQQYGNIYIFISQLSGVIGFYWNIALHLCHKSTIVIGHFRLKCVFICVDSHLDCVLFFDLIRRIYHYFAVIGHECQLIKWIWMSLEYPISWMLVYMKNGYFHIVQFVNYTLSKASEQFEMEECSKSYAK